MSGTATTQKRTKGLTYFISDTHLGAHTTTNRPEQERRVVEFLRSIKPTARRLYLLGDILDYWYEYKTVVPRGFTRFFGVLADLADSGVEITWFIGNHDIWIFDYLATEIGLRVVDGQEIIEMDGKRFFLGHGDGLGKVPFGFRFIRSMFRNRFCQKLYASIHPRWTVPFAYKWSASSRGLSTPPERERGEQEPIIDFAKEYEQTHPHIDYFVFGHFHQMLNEEIAPDTNLVILGDWIKLFSYGEWDGKELKLKKFE